MTDRNPLLGTGDAAPVIARPPRPLEFIGSLTILKDHLRRVRPQFQAARCYQRTSYLPGELAQVDWGTRVCGSRSARARPGRCSGWSADCRPQRRRGWCSP
jgi:hypothetical protein